MVTKIKCTLIFLIVCTLIPFQVRAEDNVETSGEIMETSEQNVGQVINEDPEAEKKTETVDQAEIESDLEEAQAENDYKIYSEEEYEVPPNETTGTELSYSVVPNPKVETVGNAWRFIKDKKYVLTITITNNSSKDWKDILVSGYILNEDDLDNIRYISFYPQNGITVRDYLIDGLSPNRVDGEAVVALLKSGESITLQAEVIILKNMRDTATLYVGSELYPGAPLGGELFDLILVNEKQPAQENPKSESGTKTNTVAKTNDKGSTIKTAAKTGDNSSTIVYYGVITLSALTIILCRKRRLY